VGIGPGTFSGLRVGVATARGLAQGLKLPLAGSSSLKALAAGLAGNAGNEGKNLLPVIDAKRGQVFAQLFSSNKAGKVEPLSEIMCLSANDLITSLNRQAEGPIIAGGDGALVYLDRFTDAGIEVPGVDDASNHIQARYHLDAADGEPGFSLEGIAGVIPAYVRNPDADKTILLRKKEPWLK
jgi:tRNA threonylcarbamoyl adenosine modification protein YeaZ